MLSNEQVDQIKRDGYRVVDGFVHRRLDRNDATSSVRIR